MKVLIVLTSHDKLGNTGEKTGFWLEEFAAPYYVLKDAGADIVLASPKGGQPPLDPKSDQPDFQTDDTRRFNNDAAAQKQLANTVALETDEAEDFDAVFYPGGHGPLWDLTDNPHSLQIIETLYAAGKPVASVCHAPTALINAKDKSGRYLVENKNITAFSNSEEDGVGLSQVVPFLLEDALKQRGAVYH